MATIALLGTVAWDTNTGNKTVASVTPTDGDLLVAICANTGRTTAQPPTVADTLAGGTWSQFSAAMTMLTNVNSGWGFVRDNLVVGAASTTITMTQTSDTGGGMVVWRVSGMARSGLNAIRRMGKQDNHALGTPACTPTSPSGAWLTGNPGFGIVLTNSTGTANCVPPASWTEDFDNSFSTPTGGLEAVSRSSGETGSTVTWGGATTAVYGAILFELDATIPVVPDFMTQPRIPRV